MLLLFILNLKSPTVADLVKDTFFDFTSKEQRISVINFYGKNCPACVDSEDTFEELSRMYWQEPRVVFGQLDCDRYSDVCDSIGAVDRPAWLAWIPGQTRPKRYNRNIDTEQFEKWIRQQTGIWPTAKANNLLYINSTDLTKMTKKKLNCIFTILDTPRLEASQPLHNASRTLEKKVKRGAKFFAVDETNAKDLKQKLFKDGQKFGAFLFTKGNWIPYNGKSDPDEITSFLREQKCNVAIATPTPTPTPLDELEDLPDDEYVPVDEEEPENKIENEPKIQNKNKENANNENDDDDISEFSNDEM